MKFVLTEELGRLSKWLRILGFDATIEKDRRAIAIESLKSGRIILTRDSKMSRFTGTRMVKIQSDFVEEQIEQVIKELGIKIDRGSLFTLCVDCNKPLKAAAKESVKGEVPAYVFQTQESFKRCPKCSKVYWQGTHWELVNKFLERVKA
jgi:uncharacterized protein with PIN domain